MPIKVEVHHDQQLVLVTGDGPLRLADITAYFAKLTVNNTLSYRKIFDGRGAYLELSSHDIEVLRGMVRAMGARGTRGPLAIVATTSIGIAGAHLFMNFPAHDRITMLFDSVDDALVWVLKQPISLSRPSSSDPNPAPPPQGVNP